MSPLSAGDYGQILELVARALGDAGPGFPGTPTTGLMAGVFDAEFGGAGDVDLRGTASRAWADVPAPRPMPPERFHDYATHHPLAKAFLRPGPSVPLRLSDIASDLEIRRNTDELGFAHLLAIPLAVTPRHLGSLVLMRSGMDFTDEQLRVATQLQPVLAGVYRLRDRFATDHGAGYDADTGIPLSGRELGVLDLMADGLIAAAIARRLGISPRTVSKHIESIYRKLGTHDRTTTVLRAQRMGVLDFTQPEGYPAPPLPRHIVTAVQPRRST